MKSSLKQVTHSCSPRALLFFSYVGPVLQAEGKSEAFLEDNIWRSINDEVLAGKYCMPVRLYQISAYVISCVLMIIPKGNL